MTRIAFFLPSLEGGGAEQVMLGIASGFADRGLCVDLVLVSARGPYINQVPNAVNIIDFHATKVSSSLIKLIRYFRKYRPDIVVSALDHANLIAIIAKKISRQKIKLAISVHGVLSDNHSGIFRFKERLIPIMARLLYRSADKIIAVSAGVAADLVQNVGIGDGTISVIHNPVKTEEIVAKSLEAIPPESFLSGDVPLIMSIGRLNRLKDYPSLIRAFAEVRKSRKARLVILGEGEERSNLEKLISQLGMAADIWMPGFVENPYPYLRNASVFVLTSISEGFGNVIVEAMVLGIPIVCTECPGGPREILDNGKWGRLVPVGDVHQIAEAILDALNGKVIDGRKRASQFTAKNALEAYSVVLGLTNTA